MASAALTKWQTVRRLELDQFLEARVRVGGGRGRRYATEQLDFFYLVAIAAQFQGFCRDLHSEAAVALASLVPSPSLKTILQANLTSSRGLDKGNANWSTIGEDFARLGMVNFWELVAVE